MEGKSVTKSWQKIKKIKQKVKPRGAKAVLNDPDVKTYLEQLIVDLLLPPLTKQLITLFSFAKNTT